MKSDKLEEKENKDKEIKDIIRGFIGKNIIVVLRGKKTFKGRLESSTRYELLVTVAHQPVLIMKHAIDFIELDDV